MSSKFFRYSKMASLLVIAAIFSALFQNCVGRNFEAPKDKPFLSTSGHGDSYSGKLTAYVYFDSAHPCLSPTTPNHQIFVTGSRASLVRQNCIDINPLLLNSDSYALAMDGGLTYGGLNFNIETQLNRFNTVPRLCPNGGQSGPFVTGSLFPDPTNIASWSLHSEAFATVARSLGGLPIFAIGKAVDGPDFRQLAGRVVFKPSTEYAFSVWMAPGSSNQNVVYVHIDDDNNFGWSFDLSTGQSRNHHVTSGFPLSAMAGNLTPWNGGFIATVFFRTAIDAPNVPAEIQFGVQGSLNSSTLMMLNAGDFTHVSAMDLREVNSYCQ